MLQKGENDLKMVVFEDDNTRETNTAAVFGGTMSLNEKGDRGIFLKDLAKSGIKIIKMNYNSYKK